MVNLISLKETYDIIGESHILEENFIDNSLKVIDNSEKSVRSNYFRTKPQGILLEDSYNNFCFPVQKIPRLDTNKCDLITLVQKFRELYLSFKSDYLPWHYVVELIGDRYFVFNTRPINIIFPRKHEDAINNSNNLPFDISWNEETKDFMHKRRFLIEDAIHVCILGDSTRDVYPKKIYRVLGTTCIKPFIHYFKLPQSYKTRTFALNIGSKFNVDYLFKYLYT